VILYTTCLVFVEEDEEDEEELDESLTNVI
jgi:hypothetical protein